MERSRPTTSNRVAGNHPQSRDASSSELRIKSEIDATLIRMAFARLRFSVVMTLVVIGLFVGLLWPYFPESLMWNWLIVLVSVAGARYVMWSTFTRASAEAQTRPMWRHLFLIAAVLAGASWSFGVVTLMPGPGETEAMLLSLTVIAVTVVSMVTLTMHLPAMYEFQIAALGPTVLALYGTGDEIGLLAALIVAAGTAILMVVGRASGISTQSLLETELRLSLAFAETEDARAKVEAASDAKSQFLATMSHEIRTPMNGVLGMTELLLQSELPAQQRQWTEAVHASGQHLLCVINDILDFSKIESGHLELEDIDFSVVDVVEDAVAMFVQPAEQRGLELATQFIPCNAPLRVRGDPFRLRQVIANLISNAVKFTDAGEVIERVIQNESSNRSLHLSIAVTDTGVGISKDAVARIFEHFSQADGSTTRGYGGTGLGLAISQPLLSLMDGTITVESTAGKGSTFTIDLHLPYAEVSVLLTDSSDDKVMHGVRVLVVDDNTTNREILYHQLTSWGMQVDCVASGVEALVGLNNAAQAQQPFELAILDLHMPIMDGMTLAAAIQSDRVLANTPLIMLSSTYLIADPDLRRQANIRRYLNKLLRRTDLRQALRTLLSETHATECTATTPRPQALEGALTGHVLLVEDNDINQALAEAMLQKLGLTWKLATNGEEAVAAIQTAHYDVVLMDCQMPVMDGFEATAIIRCLSDATKAGVPIIALTANAMQGDEKSCLDAGMNHFLAKPYTLPQLQSVLATWLTPTTHGHTPLDPLPARYLDVDDSVINPKALQTLRDLDESGGDALLRRIVTSFLSSADAQMNKLETAVAGGDADALRQVAHGWKSSAANLGAEMFASTLRELEKCGRQNRLADAPALLSQAYTHKVQVTKALHHLFGESV